MNSECRIQNSKIEKICNKKNTFSIKIYYIIWYNFFTCLFVIMVKIITEWLDDKIIHTSQNITQKEIHDFTWTVHEEISQDFQKDKQTKEFDYQHLLNKPNMTEKDQANMKKSIKYLIDKKMNTEKDFKKLEAINYETNYIEIWWIKRARENLKAKPNDENILQYDNEVYFTFDALRQQNILLAS